MDNPLLGRWQCSNRKWEQWLVSRIPRFGNTKRGIFLFCCVILLVLDIRRGAEKRYVVYGGGAACMWRESREEARIVGQTPTIKSAKRL